MTNPDEAASRVRAVLTAAADALGGRVETHHDETDAIIDGLLDVQGHDSAPAALLMYWRLVGTRGGLWREFARCGGFDVRDSLRSRLIAIETSLLNGSNWQKFRFAEPLITFRERPGGEVFWVEFDSDDADADHDPPVWMLTEEPGTHALQVADSFSGYIESMVAREVAIRTE